MKNFIISKSNKDLLIKIIILIGYGILSRLVPIRIIQISGIISLIISSILLYKLSIKIIDSIKDNKIKTIIYSILSVIFILIFLYQSTTDTVFLAKKIKEVTVYKEYVIGTVEKINETSIIVNTIVNNKEKKYEIKSVPDSGYNINDEIYIYINPDNIEDYILIHPTYINMLYIGIYFTATGITFFLAFIPTKKLYRLKKPKVTKNNIKVKKG